ncbi:MAG: hypothetical protein ACE5LU_29120 [Anaerolineae bacterium]
MATTLTTIPDLFSTSALAWIDFVLTDTFDQHPQIMEKLFKVVDSDKPHEQTTGVASFGQLSQLSELQQLPLRDRVQGFDKTFTHGRYSMGHEIGRMTYANDRKGVLRDVPVQLGRSLVETVETQGSSVFNNGFGSETTPDGLSIFNTAHTTPAAGTVANRPSTDVDLSVTSLEDAMVQFMDFIDQAGKKIMRRPQFLVHPFELSFTTARILESNMDPESANRAVNPVSGARLGLAGVSWEFLTDTDAWFLVGAPADNGLVWYWRQRPLVEHDVDFFKKSLLTSIEAWFSFGARDWRGLWGTSGA